MVSGRKPGYKHDKGTKEKISTTLTGQKQDDITKDRIKQTMRGKSKTEAHRAAISESRSDLERKCVQRFLDMRAEYPGHEEFFDTNKTKLLQSMRDVRSEKELLDIRRYIETTRLDDLHQACLAYQYDSSSIFAHELAVVELIDTLRFLQRTEPASFASSSLPH